MSRVFVRDSNFGTFQAKKPAGGRCCLGKELPLRVFAQTAMRGLRAPAAAALACGPGGASRRGRGRVG